MTDTPIIPITDRLAVLYNTLAELGEPSTPFDNAWAEEYDALGCTAADVPALIALADLEQRFDDEDDLDAEERLRVAVHAWRTLAHLKAPETMETYLRAFKKAVGTANKEWYISDAIPLAVRIGAPAMEPMIAVFADRSVAPEWRQWLAEALTRLVESAPSCRDAVVAALTVGLRRYREQSNLFNAIIAGALVELHAVETAPLIEEAYTAGRADLSFCGDWEDIQVALGLLPARITPQTDEERRARWDTTHDNAYVPPVADLLGIGRPSSRGSIDDHDFLARGIGPEHVPDLIRMVCDERLHTLPGDDKGVYAPIHAWRALAQLRAGDAIEPLLSQMYRFDVDGDDWISEDYPHVFEKIGRAAVPHLERFLLDRTRGEFSRMCAVGSLERLMIGHPDIRDRVIDLCATIVRRADREFPTVVADCIWVLATGKAVEHAAIMERAYALGRVDESMCGDLEDMQVRMGVIPHRITPHPPSMMQRMMAELEARGLTEEDALRNIESADYRPPVPKQNNAKSRAHKKAKRKQQKASRKRNRR